MDSVFLSDGENERKIGNITAQKKQKQKKNNPKTNLHIFFAALPYLHIHSPILSSALAAVRLHEFEALLKGIIAIIISYNIFCGVSSIHMIHNIMFILYIK